MVHKIVWVDIPVIDLNRAIEFYSEVLDCEIEKHEHEGAVFALLPHEDNDVAGCLVLDPSAKPSKEGPLVYFNVNQRIDKAIAAAKAHGATIIEDKTQIGPWGYRAIIIDSEGNRVALHSL